MQRAQQRSAPRLILHASHCKAARRRPTHELARVRHQRVHALEVCPMQCSASDGGAVQVVAALCRCAAVPLCRCAAARQRRAASKGRRACSRVLDVQDRVSSDAAMARCTPLIHRAPTIHPPHRNLHLDCTPETCPPHLLPALRRRSVCPPHLWVRCRLALLHRRCLSLASPAGPTPATCPLQCPTPVHGACDVGQLRLVVAQQRSLCGRPGGVAGAASRTAGEASTGRTTAQKRAAAHREASSGQAEEGVDATTAEERVDGRGVIPRRRVWQ